MGGSGKGESREVEGGRETEVLLCCLVFHLLEIEKGAIVKIFNYIDSGNKGPREQQICKSNLDLNIADKPISSQGLFEGQQNYQTLCKPCKVPQAAVLISTLHLQLSKRPQFGFWLIGARRPGAAFAFLHFAILYLRTCCGRIS